MKALRYLLMVMAVLSVLSISAQTPQYGKTYKPRSERAVFDQTQVSSQMPEAAMGSTASEYMTSGSTLPQAAVTGTTTTYGNGRPGNIRRGADEGDTPPVDPHGPNEDPIGDVMWPLALCALAYLIMRVARRRLRA